PAQEDEQGEWHPPQGELEQADFVQDEQRAENMDAEPWQLAQRTEIIHKAHGSDQHYRQGQWPGGIAHDKSHQYRNGKNNPASTDGEGAMRRTLIGFVDDIVAVGYFKIQQQAAE